MCLHGKPQQLVKRQVQELLDVIRVRSFSELIELIPRSLAINSDCMNVGLLYDSRLRYLIVYCVLSNIDLVPMESIKYTF